MKLRYFDNKSYKIDRHATIRLCVLSDLTELGFGIEWRRSAIVQPRRATSIHQRMVSLVSTSRTEKANGGKYRSIRPGEQLQISQNCEQRVFKSKETRRSSKDVFGQFRA
uniref:Uncharacterized protein n=1 Tax=Caenorhabditis japonica TaxID=281687 RepID=A0A8R1ED83_CAEJA